MNNDFEDSKGKRNIPAIVALCLVSLAVVGYIAYASLCYDSKRDCRIISATQGMVSRASPLSLAILLFHRHTNRYPMALDELYDKPGDAEIASKWKGPYVQSKDEFLDEWKKPLQYASPGRHNKDGYDLWSVGPDGQDGTTDDIGNW